MNKKLSLIGILAIVLTLIIISTAILAIGVQTFSNITDKRECIAEIEIKGPIYDEVEEDRSLFAPEPPPSGPEIVKEIKRASKDEKIKAILLYIDSPGGEVIPSRELYEAIKETNKTTVAYIRNYGTSGAYYAAVGADYIVAEPEAIVGNIGVRATFLSARELFENLGIDYNTVTTGDKKDMGDIGRPLSEEEEKLVKDMLNEIFADFKGAVIENRGKINESIFDGRILSGKQAYKYHLIDKVGSKSDALDKAAELAGIKKYKVCKYSEDDKGFLENFMEELVPKLKIEVYLTPNLKEGMSAKIN